MCLLTLFPPLLYNSCTSKFKTFSSFILTSIETGGFLCKKDLNNHDEKAQVIARNLVDFCFISSGILRGDTEFFLLVSKDGSIQVKSKNIHIVFI